MKNQNFAKGSVVVVYIPVNPDIIAGEGIEVKAIVLDCEESFKNGDTHFSCLMYTKGRLFTLKIVETMEYDYPSGEQLGYTQLIDYGHTVGTYNIPSLNKLCK